MNTLETYIKEHRVDFDSSEPSAQLWQKIDPTLKVPAAAASKISWLKYFAFGASVIAVLVVLKMKDPSPQNMTSPANDSTSLLQETGAPAIPAASSVEPELPFTLATPAPASPVKYAHASNMHQEELPIEPLAPLLHSAPENTLPVPVLQPDSSLATREYGAALNVDTSFSGIRRLEINCSSFDVNVQPGSTNEIRFKANASTVTRSVTPVKNTYSVTYERKDSTLIITVKNTIKGQIIGSSVQKSSALLFDAPENTSIVINNSYGNVQASGFRGEVFSIHTKSGDIDVKNISTTAQITSGYGNVKATGMTGSLKAELKSGDLFLTDMSGNVEAKSSYGNQTYKNINGDLKSTSASGDVKITGMKGKLDLATTYGNTSLESYSGDPVLSAKSGDISGKDVELISGMTVSTSYGDIKMSLLNKMDDLSFDLISSYGQITIDKEVWNLKKDDQLKITKGKILVKGSSSSGDQVYK